jgi:L-alanine-DL-glutamate epimerase-like enolase superfamily enzyme
MTLKDIKTFVVGNPPPHYGGRYFVFVKLTTNSNVSGIGEAYCLPFHPDVVVKMIEDVFVRYLQGTGSARHRDDVATRVLRRIHATLGSRADGRAQCARDGLLGHHRQGSRAARLQIARRPRARTAALLHVHL